MALSLQEISDRLELHDLVTRYADIIDRKAFQELSTIFTEAAEIDYEATGAPKCSVAPVEDTDAMPQIPGSSISYRIAVGPQQGRKAFMIRTIRPLDRPDLGLLSSRYPAVVGRNISNLVTQKLTTDVITHFRRHTAR